MSYQETYPTPYLLDDIKKGMTFRTVPRRTSNLLLVLGISIQGTAALCMSVLGIVILTSWTVLSPAEAWLISSMVFLQDYVVRKRVGGLLVLFGFLLVVAVVLQLIWVFRKNREEECR
jgi:hypothetical protein